MSIDVVELCPGAVVECNGRRFVIEAIEDFDRVLARGVIDDRREFLAVRDLKRPQRSPDPTHPAFPVDVLEDSDELEIVRPAKGRWHQQIAARQVRPVPPDHHQTHEERAALRDATEHFQELAHVLAFPTHTAERTAALAELIDKRGYSKATAYRYLAIAKAGGCAEALLTARRSDAGDAHISDEQRAVIRMRFASHRLIPEKHPMESVRVLINGDLRALGEKEVSLKTLYRLEHKVYPKRERLIAEGRKDEARNRFGSRAGVLPDLDYPLTIVQIDHTTIQVIFVDEQDRLPLSDAWITLVIDCFSRMVLGYYLSFDPPSATSTGIALSRAFLPKHEHLENVGVVGDWPCWGYPRVILADNATELNGHMMQDAARMAKFTIRNRPVGMPNFGGAIESAFRTFMHLQRSIKGTKFSNPTERAEYDSKKHAFMTLSEFDSLFTEFLVNDYHLREHEGREMNKRSPLQRWRGAILEGEVFPPAGLPAVPANPERLKISMLPIATRVVRNMVVEFNKETYFSPELSRISDQIDPKQPTSERKHEIRYDPRNMAQIWVLDPSDGHYIAAYVQNVSWTFRSKWECDAIRARHGTPAKEFEEARYQSKLKQDEIKAEADRATKAARAKKGRKRSEQDRRNELETLAKPKPVPRADKPKRANPLLQRQADIASGKSESAEVTRPRVRIAKIEGDVE